jgi:hypothetical protein
VRHNPIYKDFPLRQALNAFSFHSFFKTEFVFMTRRNSIHV